MNAPILRAGLYHAAQLAAIGSRRKSERSSEDRRSRAQPYSIDSRVSLVRLWPVFRKFAGDMATSTSIAELQRTGITFAPTKLSRSRSSSSQPGRRPLADRIALRTPSPENTYVDDEGFVVCRACETTPAVSEIAIFLQAVLPVGTPRVPGALRYTIAPGAPRGRRAAVDSIQQLSAGAHRFESGDRRPSCVRSWHARNPSNPRRSAGACRRSRSVSRLDLPHQGRRIHAHAIDAVFHAAAGLTQARAGWRSDTNHAAANPGRGACPIHSRSPCQSRQPIAPVTVDKTMKPVAKPARSRSKGLPEQSRRAHPAPCDGRDGTRAHGNERQARHHGSAASALAPQSILGTS